jgi:hypothetical protein
VAGRTNDSAGDGTTTASVLAREIIHYGLQVCQGLNSAWRASHPQESSVLADVHGHSTRCPTTDCMAVQPARPSASSQQAGAAAPALQIRTSLLSANHRRCLERSVWPAAAALQQLHVLHDHVPNTIGYPGMRNAAVRTWRCHHTRRHQRREPGQHQDCITFTKTTTISVMPPSRRPSPAARTRSASSAASTRRARTWWRGSGSCPATSKAPRTSG